MHRTSMAGSLTGIRGHLAMGDISTAPRGTRMAITCSCGRNRGMARRGRIALRPKAGRVLLPVRVQRPRL